MCPSGRKLGIKRDKKKKKKRKIFWCIDKFKLKRKKKTLQLSQPG